MIVEPLAVGALPPILAEKINPVVARLGYLGALIAIQARQPEVLEATMATAAALRCVLDEETIEVVALTVSAGMDNSYELFQHEQLCQRRHYSHAWIAQASLRQPTGSGDGLTDAQARIQQVCRAMIGDHGRVNPALLAKLVSDHGADRVVALLQCVSYFYGAGLLSNALRLESPVPSVFAGEADDETPSGDVRHGE